MADRRISIARVIACFMVVLLHSTPSTADQNAGWWAAHSWNAVTRACVPIFFMISGATLLYRDVTIGDFIVKRLLRIAPPLIVWSCVYLGWLAYNGAATGNWVLRIVEGPVMFHLWYFYAILGIYAFVPLLNRFVQNSSAGEVAWYLGIWFVATSLGPMLLSLNASGCGYLAPGPLQTIWHLGPFIGYSGYLGLGPIK